MLNKLIDWSVANRLLVVLGLLAALGAAVTLIPRLNLDAFPDVTNVQVQINTEAPGTGRRGGGAAHYLSHRGSNVCPA